MDYERHWLESARRLLEGFDRTRIFTSAFQFWWNLWREGEKVIVQEQMLVNRKLALLFESGDYYRRIDKRQSSEGDVKIAEWAIGLGDIHDFVERRMASPV